MERAAEHNKDEKAVDHKTQSTIEAACHRTHPPIKTCILISKYNGATERTPLNSIEHSALMLKIKRQRQASVFFVVRPCTTSQTHAARVSALRPSSTSLPARPAKKCDKCWIDATRVEHRKLNALFWSHELLSSLRLTCSRSRRLPSR